MYYGRLRSPILSFIVYRSSNYTFGRHAVPFLSFLGVKWLELLPQHYRQRNVEANVIYSCLVPSVEPLIYRCSVCCLAQIETHAVALL